MDAIAKQSGAVDQPSVGAQGKATRETMPARGSMWGRLGWVTAAAMLVIAALLWSENSALKQSLAAMSGLSEHQARELDSFFRIVAAIRSPKAQRMTLVATRTPPQPQGKAFYLRQPSSLVFVANNMPQLPPHKAYELWLVPAQGAPIAAGIFKPDARGSATIVNPPLPAGVEAKAFAITVEDEAGVPHATTPIIMIGAGE